MSGSKRGRCPTVTEVDVRQQQKSVSGSNRNLCPAATEVARDFRPPLWCEWDLRSSATLHRVGCPQMPRVVMAPGSDIMVYFTTLLAPHLTTTKFSWPHHLGARCRLVVNAMPRPLNPRERVPIRTAGLDVWRREIMFYLRRSSNPRPPRPKFTRCTSYGSSAPRQYRCAPLNDNDTFWEIRRCANVIECTYTNLDTRVWPTTHLGYMV